MATSQPFDKVSDDHGRPLDTTVLWCQRRQSRALQLGMGSAPQNPRNGISIATAQTAALQQSASSWTPFFLFCESWKQD